MRAWPADFLAPLSATLGGDHLTAVETPALVVVVVGQVLGDQFQAVVAPRHGLQLVAPVRSHGFLAAEGALPKTVVDGVPHAGVHLAEGGCQGR